METIVSAGNIRAMNTGRRCSCECIEWTKYPSPESPQWACYRTQHDWLFVVGLSWLVQSRHEHLWRTKQMTTLGIFGRFSHQAFQGTFTTVWLRAQKPPSLVRRCELLTHMSHWEAPATWRRSTTAGAENKLPPDSWWARTHVIVSINLLLENGVRKGPNNWSSFVGNH